MITYLFMTVAFLCCIECILNLCAGKIIVALVALIMSVLSVYSAATLGTFGFVYGIILAVLYGISVTSSIEKDNLFGFLFSTTMMILFIIGVSQMNR